MKCRSTSASRRTCGTGTGFSVIAPRGSVLPADIRAIVTREFESAAMLQRADIARLSLSLRDDLKKKGITFIDVDRDAFRGALAKTSFYHDWKAKYGDEAWGLMEKSVGKLG